MATVIVVVVSLGVAGASLYLVCEKKRRQRELAEAFGKADQGV